LDPLVGLQRAHLELYIRHLHDAGLRDSSINTMLHGVRGFFRFAHIDGLIAADPAVYARLPKLHADEIRTQGLDRLELIRLPRPTQDRTRSDAALSAFCCGCWQEGRTLKGPFGGMTRTSWGRPIAR
jgi:integrase/recombinase XerD